MTQEEGKRVELNPFEEEQDTILRLQYDYEFV